MKNVRENIPELLAPCGSYEALRAAVRAGADAVDLGGRELNARIGARNFGTDEMSGAVDFCHAHGVKVYVTVNTQVLTREIADALGYITSLYNIGVDALIITDIGLISLVRTFIPDFEMHASTQLGGHNAACARFLQSLGITRMVAARELNARDLRALCEESPIETEYFVHGALCASQSGGCLFSSLVGGRSGNRGMCAQPCRLPYSGVYPLSLKDNCLASHLTELSEMGVDCLKIEGRMKNADYVSGTVGTYRRLLDRNENASGADIRYLASLFSRSGFTDGYYTGKKGKAMLGIRTEADKRLHVPDPAPSYKAPRKTPIITERKQISVPAVQKPPREKSTRLNTARFYDPGTLAGEDFFDIIYLPLDKYDARANGIMLPPVIMPHEYERARALIGAAGDAGCEHILITNPGQFELARESGMTCHIDYRFNVYNDWSAELLSEYGDVMLSPELTLPQMRDIRASKSAVVYGRVPLMTLENPIGLDCLRDRRGVLFPVMREAGRDIVFNSVPIYMADRLSELEGMGIINRHFIFSCEKKDAVRSVVEAYKKGLSPQGAFTRIRKK